MNYCSIKFYLFDSLELQYPPDHGLNLYNNLGSANQWISVWVTEVVTVALTYSNWKVRLEA